MSRTLLYPCLAGLSLFVACLAVLPSAAAERAPVRIGMVQTLFTDIPTPLVWVGLQPFGGLMKDFTGLDGKMIMGGDALSLAKDLDEGKVDVAIFHGVEFAWAKQKFPRLRPLMCAITKYKHAQAHLIVRKEMDGIPVAELKGKIASVPLCSREHCRLFLDRACMEAGNQHPKQFFSKVVASSSIERALDDLCLGKLDAVVTDTVSLETYQDLKPGCFNRLKVLKDSELFPTGLIAYRDGSLDTEVIDRFRNGLVEGHKNERGREVMRMFRITSFETMPEDYEQNLSDIIKAYPAPETASPVSTQR
jgi:ABC-type phosphate/phosphonate transport system substrate-binding protein